MKPVFKCEYCSKMGTEEEIREHEPNCVDNYDKKSCDTCVHRDINIQKQWYDCKLGVEISKGKIYLFCDTYERKEKINDIGDLFGNWFGLGR